MTITLGNKSSTAELSPNNGTLERHSEPASTPEGQSFGQFMSEMLQSQPNSSSPDTGIAQIPSADDIAGKSTDGQLIAEAVTIGPDDLFTTQAWPLREMSLGPNLNVITNGTAAPDPQSLEAFARAQGLDENAVNWLFGTPPTGTAAATPNLQPSAATQSAMGLPATPITVNTTPTPTATANAANANATVEDSIATQITVAQSNAGNILTAAQALGAMVDSTTQSKNSDQPAATDATEDGTPISLLRMPPPAAVWMQRSLMNSALQEAVTAQKGADIAESELDLGAEWGPDLLHDLLAKEGVTVNGSGATGTQGTAYANFAARWDAQAIHRSDAGSASQLAQTELANTATRSENIQNLADKMGQAVGQRILSEMEKGQWHLKLQLRPATLGHIEVEMRMRSGEFDAVFTAPNATTRDLLQDGMSKLRETLAQMGMDVASIHVGDGQTGQSGGQSTPDAHRGQTAPSGASAEATANDTTRAPLVKTTKDGLDVLV